MKIFKSIKWRLQVWYGLILVLVLAGFGVTADRLEWGRQMRGIDEELQRRLGIIAQALRPPPRRPDFGGQPFGSPPPDRRPPAQSPGPPVEFHLPPFAAGLFGTNGASSFYFVIKSRDGEEIARGGKEPTLNDFYRSFHEEAPLPSELTANSPRSPSIRMWPGFREMIQILPAGETVLVGCNVAPELKELHRMAFRLAGAGAVILVFGLAGGSWLVSRAIRPIENISAAATKISAGDLSQRINVAETESELGRLAAVLNSTFARLEAAFAQQRQFAADAAHELRTPVSVMLTQTQTALSRERDAGEYRQTVEACLRSAQRMRRLIESLLELARLEAGQEPMKRVPVDLSQTVGDCAESIRPLAEERGVKIYCELAPVKCTGDADRLAQVVANLLANAVQYNREKGEVHITTQSRNGMAILAVANTGPGIPTADLPHIFERFYRADPSRSSGHAGLGLAITKAIVEAHGGIIEVSSEENVETTFTVRWPA